MPRSPEGYVGVTYHRKPMARMKERARRKAAFVRMIMANKELSKREKKKRIDAYTGFEQ